MTKRVFMACAFSLVLAACPFYDSRQDLLLELPAKTDPWGERFPAPNFFIRYPKNGGGVEEIVVNPGGKKAFIRIVKNSAIPVIAIPVAEGMKLPPAGGVFPYHSSAEGQLTLSWEHGPLSLLLMKLELQGMSTGSLDLTRLEEEMRGICKSDPWILDLEHIAERLASGSFRVTDIKKLPEKEVTVFPGEGIWITESPFTGTYESGMDGAITVVLTHGYHRIISLTSRIVYDVAVSDEEVIMLRRPGSGPSGRTTTGVINRSWAEEVPEVNREFAVLRSGFPVPPDLYFRRLSHR